MIDAAYTGYTDIAPAAAVQTKQNTAAQTTFQSLLNERINEKSNAETAYSSISVSVSESMSSLSSASPLSSGSDTENAVISIDETVFSDLQALAESLIEQLQTESGEDAYAEVLKRLLKLIDEITDKDLDYRSAMITLADILASAVQVQQSENEPAEGITTVLAAAQSNRVSTQIGDGGNASQSGIHLQEQEQEPQIERKPTVNDSEEIITDEAYIAVTEAYPATAEQTETNEFVQLTEANTAEIKNPEIITVKNIPVETAETFNGQIAEESAVYPNNANEKQSDYTFSALTDLTAETSTDSSVRLDDAAKMLFDELLTIARDKSGFNYSGTQEKTVSEEDLFILSYPHELTAVKNTGRNPQNLSNLKNKPEEFTQLLKAVKGENTETETKPIIPVQITQDISLYENNLNVNLNTGEAAEDVQNPVASQLSDVIEAKIKTLDTGETEFEMTLAPENLGRVNIKLVTENGRVSVVITAEKQETSALLQNRAEQLGQNLRQNGVELERYVVYHEQGQEAYYNQDSGRGRQNEQERERENRERFSAESENGDDNGLSFSELIQAI